MNHSEACRARIEKAISEDKTDDRATKAKERIDHYLAEKVGADAEVGEEREQDPRGVEPEQLPVQEQSTQRLDIGSPMKNEEMDFEDDLDDGPTKRTERRVRTPVRAPPVQRRVTVHE